MALPLKHTLTFLSHRWIMHKNTWKCIYRPVGNCIPVPDGPLCGGSLHQSGRVSHEDLLHRHRQHDYWPRVETSKFFDGKLISADVKVVKPQPEIYRLLRQDLCAVGVNVAEK